MAVLQQPVVSGNVFAEQIGDDLAPAGTYVATVLDIVDEFGVQRQKFQSVEVETVDLTTFLFGFRDAQGYEHRVASRRMKISGNEKSSLFAFLKSLLGHAPQYGWDYMALKGAQCLVTVEHIQRRDGTGVFAGIAALSPVPQGMGGAGGQLAVGGGQTGSGAVAPRPPLAPPRPPAAPVGGAPMRPTARAVAPSPAPARAAGSMQAGAGQGEPLPF
ncbi:MAG: hypothetical protein WCS01_12765 [bacterium]